MHGEPLRSTVKVTNAQGLHMRPMAAFVQLASKFQSSVFVCRGDQRIDGKSPLGLLSLAAEQGTELTLEVAGPDQQEALEALVKFLGSLAAQEDAQ